MCCQSKSPPDLWDSAQAKFNFCSHKCGCEWSPHPCRTASSSLRPRLLRPPKATISASHGELEPWGGVSWDAGLADVGACGAQDSLAVLLPLGIMSPGPRYLHPASWGLGLTPALGLIRSLKELPRGAFAGGLAPCCGFGVDGDTASMPMRGSQPGGDGVSVSGVL